MIISLVMTVDGEGKREAEDKLLVIPDKLQIE